MKRHVIVGLLALALAAPAFAEEAAPVAVEVATASVAAPPALVVERRELILSADGARVGNVMSLNEDGSPRVIFNQKVLTIPASTLSRADGRLVTSLTHRDLMRMD